MTTDQQNTLENEKTMIEAHQAGMAYWKRNRVRDDVTYEQLASLARSLHWHGADSYAWIAGFYGAKSRELTNANS